jgi:hypothetical protein
MTGMAGGHIARSARRPRLRVSEASRLVGSRQRDAAGTRRRGRLRYS